MTIQISSPSAEDATFVEMKGVMAKLRNAVAWLTAKIDLANAYLAPVTEAQDSAIPSPMRMARKPILLGAWVFIFLFGFFGLWATLAPIASAAVAPGKIILSGSRKTIQHLEGGVVDEILVQEGDTIRKGQPLIKLNEIAARARLDLFRKQYLAALATEARLLAERDNKKNLIFPEEVLEKKDDKEVSEMIDSQKRLFDSRRDSINSQIDILKKKKSQYRNQIEGLEAQIKSATDQIGLLQQEINAVSTLLRQGNAQKPRLLALQRNQAELKGRKGEYESTISRTEQAIAEADLQILNIRNEFSNKVAAEYKENVDKIADLQERLKASVDIIDRIIITAPLSGIITDLRAHTIGGVIKPGDKIMDIVPIDELLVQAAVAPQDIDVVTEGLEARVRLTAYKSRTVPPLAGRVVHVSPDRYDNEQTGQSFYWARIKISPEELQANDLQLTPGMPADVLIVTGERSLVSYIMAPITESIHKAFREE
jgi:HlyD family type I secretion membrane fusion protein